MKAMNALPTPALHSHRSPLKPLPDLSHTRVRTASVFVAIILAAATFVNSQDLPRSIRGYKIHGEIIKLKSKAPGPAEGPYVVVGRPRVSDISLGGVTLTITGELGDAGHEGRVEMLTFRDFRINGMSVDVAEYNTPFDLKKRGRVALPAGADVFLPATMILNAGWNELTGSKKEWPVTGRVFVFGKFRKFGFSFKRVILIDIDLTIENPLVEYREKIRSAFPSP